MTSDEALIEKMAEAMWNETRSRKRDLAWHELRRYDDDALNLYLRRARAALSVVREEMRRVEEAGRRVGLVGAGVARVAKLALK